jgi:hypothetical protein
MPKKLSVVIVRAIHARTCAGEKAKFPYTKSAAAIFSERKDGAGLRCHYLNIKQTSCRAASITASTHPKLAFHLYRNSLQQLKMKGHGLIFSTFLASALAAPAVVWKNARRESERVLHRSDPLKASDLLKDALDVQGSDSSLAGVVFLVGKDDDGEETFSDLASTGKLPVTASKYDEANGIYHHVSGIESTNSMVRQAARANSGHRVLQVSLGEWNSKLTSLGGEPVPELEMEEVAKNGLVSKVAKHAHKRARELASADIFVVTIDAKEDPSLIDSAVVKAIESEHVENVIFAGIRSVNEVKRERYFMSKRRLEIMEQEGSKVIEAQRRRLEQEEEQGDEENGNNNNNNNGDLSGVYYVAMTPNILAGILFGLLFTVITWIGISCMGAIQGQEVFVSKMPSIGREA